jgi:capsular exopolysaccharide synthesis family protein
MSNLFDALKRENAIDLNEICDLEAANVVGAPEIKIASSEGPAIVHAPATARRIARLRVSALAPLFPFEEIHHVAAEQYRIIRTKILHSEKKPRLLVVSSAGSGDGKTVTSINLAASLALKTETSVLLVDADLRRPRIATELGIPETPGLSDVVAGRVSFEEALIRAEQFENLHILPAGDAAENPAELFDSDRWRRLIEQLRSRFAMVVFDTTPVATVADYELLQLVCDAIIVVIRPDHTNRKACAKVLETVPKDKLLGVVLNGVEEWLFWNTPANDYYRKLPPGQNVLK